MSAMLGKPIERARSPAFAGMACRRADFVRIRGLVRNRLGHAALLAALVMAIELLRVVPLLPEGRPNFPRVPLELFGYAMLEATVVIVALTIALALPVRGWRRAALVVASLAVALACTTFLRWSLSQLANFAVEEGIVVSLQAHLMYSAWQWTALGSGLATFYLLQEREAALAARARDAVLHHLQLQRTVMQSRLEVIQARVEPEFLFAALDDVQRLYLLDPPLADRMVDELIVYLRAALPQIRGGLSTIGREVELARAFVAVLQVPRGKALDVEFHADAEVFDHLLPPMVLLPITQAAFARNAAAARRRASIVARQMHGGAAIVVEVDGGSCPDAWQGDGAPATRRALSAYHGDAATLTFSSSGDRHRAEINLPAIEDWPQRGRRAEALLG